MNPIKFKKYKNGNVNEYHFYLNNEKQVIGRGEDFFHNKKLWEDWCTKEGTGDAFKNFNISNHKTGTNILLYMVLIWELSQDKKVQGIGTWQTDSIQDILAKLPILVDWEYELEHEFKTNGILSRNNGGFKKAESPTIHQYGFFVNETPICKTGLFELNTFQELSDFLKPGFHDAKSLSNYFISNTPERVATKLRNQKKPDFQTLLSDDDIFVGLLTGEDFGYYDYLIIASKVDLTKELDLIREKLNNFAKDYIVGIKTAKNTEEMVRLIEYGIKKYEGKKELSIKKAERKSSSALPFGKKNQHQQLILKDKRKLGFAEYGSPNGFPIIYCHGSQSSRLEMHYDLSFATDNNLRIITIDRPGHGISDFNPDGSILSFAQDAKQLTDHLNLSQFQVVGMSAGAPFALGMGYVFPTEVMEVSIISGFAPFDTESSKHLSKEVKTMLGLAKTFPFLLKILLKIQAKQLKKNPAKALNNFLKIMSQTDQEVLKNKSVMKIIENMFIEAFRNGSEGVAHEISNILVKPWEFELSEIKVPVTFWQGEKDNNVPLEWAELMKNQIKNAHIKTFPEEGHLIIFNHAEEIF